MKCWRSSSFLSARITGLLVIMEMSAVAMVVPAYGMSFGVAPAGTCRCTTCLSKKSGFVP